MSSYVAKKSAVAPFTNYVVENNGGYILKTLTLGDTQYVEPNSILSDMGKTSVIDGYIYRKVQYATKNGKILTGNMTGYICLNSDKAPLFDGDSQGTSKLN